MFTTLELKSATVIIKLRYNGVCFKIEVGVYLSWHSERLIFGHQLCFFVYCF